MQAFAHNYCLITYQVTKGEKRVFLNSTLLLGYKSGCACFVRNATEIVAENDQYHYHFDILMLGLVGITLRTMR